MEKWNTVTCMHISYIAIAISIIYKLKYAVIKNADKIEKKS